MSRIKDIEDYLRQKIEEARDRGFKVTPFFGRDDSKQIDKFYEGGAVSHKEKCCCIMGAASQLENKYSFDEVSFFTEDEQEVLEAGFERSTWYAYNQHSPLYKLGAKLRRECLEFNGDLKKK